MIYEFCCRGTETSKGFEYKRSELVIYVIVRRRFNVLVMGPTISTIVMRVFANIDMYGFGLLLMQCIDGVSFGVGEWAEAEASVERWSRKRAVSGCDRIRLSLRDRALLCRRLPTYRPPLEAIIPLLQSSISLLTYYSWQNHKEGAVAEASTFHCVQRELIVQIFG